MTKRAFLSFFLSFFTPSTNASSIYLLRYLILRYALLSIFFQIFFYSFLYLFFFPCLWGSIKKMGNGLGFVMCKMWELRLGVVDKETHRDCNFICLRILFKDLNSTTREEFCLQIWFAFLGQTCISSMVVFLL